mgnify:CR=1 FL=1
MGIDVLLFLLPSNNPRNPTPTCSAAVSSSLLDPNDELREQLPDEEIQHEHGKVHVRDVRRDGSQEMSGEGERSFRRRYVRLERVRHRFCKRPSTSAKAAIAKNDVLTWQDSRDALLAPSP